MNYPNKQSDRTFNSENLYEAKDWMRLSEELFQRLLEYMAKNKSTIVVKHEFDPQSFMQGYSFIIDGFNLSINGFCYKPENVESFLNSKASK